MAKPLISIVTISFNQKPFLRQTIESVLSQKASNVEYIVVDPGSTDGSRELITSYGSQIDRVIFEKDRGPADGLNKGFAIAQGDVGYFLNSDDFLLPTAISVMRDFWAKNQGTDVLLCDGWMVDQFGKPLRELRAGFLTLDTVSKAGGRMFQQGMSFRMTAFQSAGGFNFANRTCWDFELLCALLESRKPAHLIRKRVAAFRLHGTSLTGGGAGKAHKIKYDSDMQRIARKYDWQLPEPSPLLQVTRDPNGLFYRLLDKFVPHRMSQRFSADHNSI